MKRNSSEQPFLQSPPLALRFDRPLVLGGFMTAGKSTVGRLVARDLGVPFLDTDELVARRAGMAVGEIFSRRGEGAFRRMEAQVVREVLPLGGVVVALGGGTLQDEALRREILSRAVLVVLAISAETALRRGASGAQRPLLGGDAAARLASRAEAYAVAHLTIDTETRTPEETATLVREQIFGNAPLFVAPTASIRLEGQTGAGPVPVFVGAGLFEALHELVPVAKTAFVVGDTLTAPLWGPRLGTPKGMHALPRGERAKTLEEVRALYDNFSACGVDRATTVAALGGGTVGDTAGFAAATWMRGVPLLQCPTTLLAMVDSALGGKTGVNRPQGKNLVGAFHQPLAVVADVRCLRTLPPEEFRQGLAEAVKYGVGEDPLLLTRLTEEEPHIVDRDPEALVHLVAHCARLKLAVVAEDERETGTSRARLNLGHTVAHALESASNFRWKHGDAVAAGLVVATTLGVRLGSCSPRFLAHVQELLGRFDLGRLPDRPWAEVLPFLARDKKFSGGSCRFVVPVEGGQSSLQEISFDDLRGAYEETRAARREDPR